MIEILSALGGAGVRLVPEVIKFFDRKNERNHEIILLDRNIELDKLRSQQAAVQADAVVGAEEFKALAAAVQAQAQPTGVKVVDAINSLMRPVITFWWVIVLYTAALVARYLLLVRSGNSTPEAVAMLWGEPERAIVYAIIGFWFTDRAIRKRGL